MNIFDNFSKINEFLRTAKDINNEVIFVEFNQIFEFLKSFWRKVFSLSSHHCLSLFRLGKVNQSIKFLLIDPLITQKLLLNLFNIHLV